MTPRETVARDRSVFFRMYVVLLCACDGLG